MRKWIVGAVVVLAAGVIGTFAYAPYLPQLLLEGFPPLVFADRGHFVAIAGTTPPRDLQTTDAAQQRELVPELATKFAESGGAALLAYRDGHLALEHYAPGMTADTRFNSYSMAKSLVGALIYKAMAEGKIANLDVTLGELLPDDRGLQSLTLRSLITMRAGIHFDTANSKFGSSNGKDNDTAPNPFGPLARLHFMGLAAIEAGLEIDATASTDFNYQNVNTALLGEVLEVVYGEPLQDLLATRLWGPALAAPALWRQPTEAATVSAYCCIYATARDWIRIGIYLSQNGAAGAPFLPEPLWREFMGLDVGPDELTANHYGQHISQNVLDRPGEALQGPFTYLLGQSGQVLYLMPQHGLVVYRAGERVQLLHSTLYGAWNSLD
jgi:CubicO group peptidase (beta-lactamase class C family)